MKAVRPRAGRVAGRGGGASAALREVNRVTREPGTPLEARTRAEMERRFGSDFSGVRLHGDVRARASAAALGARAYAIGPHIVLGDGAGPASRPAPGVLAHELAHVVQEGVRQRRGEARRVGSSTDPAERGARRAASQATAGGRARVAPLAGSQGVVRRQMQDEPVPLQGGSWDDDSISVNLTPPTTDRTEDDLREPPWCQVGGLDRPAECRPLQGCRTNNDATVVFEAIYRVDSPPPGPAYPAGMRGQDIQVEGDFHFQPDGGRERRIRQFSATGRYQGRAQPVHVERMHFTTSRDGRLDYSVQVGTPALVWAAHGSANVRLINCA